MTPARLDEFNDAWSSGDVDDIMSYFTDDCVYQASVGPEPGATYTGRDAVRQGVVDLLALDSAGESRGGNMFISGNQGVAEWSYVFSNVDGTTNEVRGCDIFEFDGDRIRRKDAFRKTYQ